ncbi:hypothetical protein, conserved [Eimeria necatrix]|uniref:Uncharacterized protein n=1 Tax=Eimeria necatrix TaxID=51315 RepID=U6N8X8_9EIME|nr:hypothetical protein, conserved [Eimeria necatrix]CDJ70326.1 hypothetical protein, conserved [Eimeria necatrix]
MQMARRFFLRKHSGLRPVYDFMRRRGHREIYMRDMLRLNAATNDLNTLISGRPAAVSPKQGGMPAAPASSVGVPTAHALAVAVGGSEKETQKLTAERTAIIRGIRSGFAALWEALQPDPELRDKGTEEATKVFPDDLPFSPALKGSPLPAPPVYTAEEASALLSPAELAEYFLESAKAVQDQSSPARSNQTETKPDENPP